jgi:enamine deaminase RidA (YjgF/YER057c/UK114 family)
MALLPVNPDSLARPVGYAHGMKGGGEWLFVAGQVGWNRDGRLVSDDFVAQFAQALDNVLDVVWAAGGKPECLARLLVFVTDTREYKARRRELRTVWRARLGRHYPAMALVQVAGLLEEGAKVEIEAVAVL